MAEELEHSAMTIRVDSVRSGLDEAEKAASSLRGYVPTAIDYLRRCDNNDDAFRTIDYLESKKEITADYANQLRSQLRTLGLRSFGSRKEHDYYQRQAVRP